MRGVTKRVFYLQLDRYERGGGGPWGPLKWSNHKKIFPNMISYLCKGILHFLFIFVTLSQSVQLLSAIEMS